MPTRLMAEAEAAPESCAERPWASPCVAALEVYSTLMGALGPVNASVLSPPSFVSVAFSRSSGFPVHASGRARKVTKGVGMSGGRRSGLVIGHQVCVRVRLEMSGRRGALSGGAVEAERKQEGKRGGAVVRAWSCVRGGKGGKTHEGPGIGVADAAAAVVALLALHVIRGDVVGSRLAGHLVGPQEDAVVGELAVLRGGEGVGFGAQGRGQGSGPGGGGEEDRAGRRDPKLVGRGVGR